MLGSAPRDPPELAEWLERSFDDQRKELKFWVQLRSFEVEEEICCSLG